jgi:hypothetical protein
MKVSFLKSLLAAATIAAAGAANASPLGYTNWSAGLGANASWGLWDTFPGGGLWTDGVTTMAAQFSNLGSSLGTSGASLSASFGAENTMIGRTPAALIQADGQGNVGGEVYTGGVTSSFSISGVVTSNISTVYLQIKQDIGAGSAGNLAGYFTPNLAGGTLLDASAGAVFADGTINYSVTTWTFAVDLSAGEQFTLNFNGAAFGHKAFDGIRIDTDGGIQAVPEPSTYAMLGLGLAVALWAARRRSIRV